MGKTDRTINGIRYEDYPSTKQEALEGGFKWYYTGLPCKHGHIAPRDTSPNKSCHLCRLIQSTKYKHTSKGIAKERELKLKHRESINERARVKNLTDEQIKKRNASTKKWHGNNKDWINNYNRLRNSKPEHRIIQMIRGNISNILRGKRNTKKQATSLELIGCDRETFKKHIEKQFVKGMNWDNRPSWHLDHIIRINFFIKHFDINDINVQNIAFHYSNLQPLFAKDNISKKDKIYFRSDTIKKNGRVTVDMDNPVFALFVHLIEVEVKKKLEILKKTNTIKDVGQLTVSVKKEFDKIIGA